MSSAFVSYAHEDQEFVLALVGHLEAQGLDVRYDRVVLHIGDSLIQAISAEIAEGDFLIAVVSPDSVVSEWCKKELSLAMTQGIDQKRVKVLPIRYRKAEVPAMLQDTYWGDADRFDVETLARQLAAAMTAHLEGRDAQAAQEAARVEDAGGPPAHAEVAGDVTVGLLDGVATKVWDVMARWELLQESRVSLRDVQDEQRRLRWEFDKLPERAQVGLPLVRQLAVESDRFPWAELTELESDIREELRSVRTQLAQGLPVTRRWVIDENLGQDFSGRRLSAAYLWQINRDDEIRHVQVYISIQAMEISNDRLPREVAQAKETKGRSVVATLLALDEPPQEVSVTTAGVSLEMPD